jgi:CRP-like cAMP-binding protein
MTAALQYFMFDHDSADVKTLFIQELDKKIFKPGEYICKEGDKGEELYVIEDGAVEVYVGEIKVGCMEVGSVFGELSLIYGTNRTASCKVKEGKDAIIYSLSKIPFRRIQATIAMSSIEVSMETFNKEMSSLSEEQEMATWVPAEVSLEEMTTHSVLGQGTFGQVTLVTATSKPGESFAMKRMAKQSIVDSEHQQRVILEKNALQAMECEFIIKLLGTYQDASSVYFLSNVVMGGDLMSYMIEQDILKNEDACFLLSNLCEGIAHCHEKGFIHRDIKPENCLIGSDGYLMLCDFGLAKRLPSTVVLPKSGTTEVVTLAFTMCGTPEFMAPEFVLSTGYTKSADWWAVGAILYEMHCGRNPFDKGGDLKKTFKAVCMIGMGREQIKITSSFAKKDKKATQLVQSLLAPDAKRLGRVKSREVCEHAYFGGLNWAEMVGKTIVPNYVPKCADCMDVSNFERSTKKLEIEHYDPYTGDEDWCKDF